MAFFTRNITRRGALRAAAATGVATAAVSILAGCTNTPEQELPSEPVVVDNSDAITVTGENGDFTYVDSDYNPTASWELPIGNVLNAAEGNWLPVLTAGASATPMVLASALDITTGTLSEVVSEPIGSATDAGNVVVYDTRCSDTAYAWVELNTLTRSWTLYAAAFSSGTLVGTPATLWNADADWAPPRFVVSGSKVIWLVMPSVSGSKTTERSTAYVWHVGDTTATAVVESPGRFATAPAISGDTITLTPRVRASEGVYYGITAYSLSDDLTTTIDRLVMPQSVRPFYAVRIGDTFAFSVEANYSSGGLLGNMGTYFGVADGSITSVSLEPYANVAGTLHGLYVVKSRASYLLVDTTNNRYSVLPAVNRSVDYGEYPARVGETTTFVTYATVKDADTGYPSMVSVRVFDLPNELPEPSPEPEDGATTADDSSTDDQTSEEDSESPIE